MDTPKPNTKLQTTAIWILIVFQMALATAVAFDLLAWWGGKNLWDQAGLLTIIFVGFAVGTFAIPTIWEEVLKKTIDRPALPFHKAAGIALLVVDVLASLALMFVYVLGLRSITVDGTRLVGYLVPGGHAKAILTIDTTSLENAFEGVLTTNAAGQADSKTYRIYEGSVIRGRKITQYDPITIRHTISIPQTAEYDLMLNWSLVGWTKVAESGGGYREFYAASGVANAPVYYNDVETSAFGGIIIQGDLYPPFLRGLVMFKEDNLILIYTGLALLLILSYAFLVRSKGIPTFTSDTYKAAQAAKAKAAVAKANAPLAPTPAASPKVQQFPPGVKVIEPDHVFGPCHLCGKTVKRDVVVEWGQVVYKMVGSRCKSCGMVICTGHHKELGYSLVKGYQTDCPKCGKPLKGNTEVLS